MARANDQVFQLSLTEIAFTITFILMLLLGYLVFKEQNESRVAKEALAKIKTLERAEEVLDAAKAGLVNALRTAGSSNPDEAITQLIAAEEARAERDRLRQQVNDLDTKLTALTELQQLIANATKASKLDAAKEEIESALALQLLVRNAVEQEPSKREPLEANQTSSQHTSALPETGLAQAAPSVQLSKEQRNREALEHVKQAVIVTSELKAQLKTRFDKSLSPGEEVQTVRDVISAAKSYGELAKNGVNLNVLKTENADFRGQIAFLKNKLEARGGRDYPPCWADENGKVEFLFSVDLRSDSVSVTPAWPPKREADARAMNGIGDVLAGSPLSHQNFVRQIQGIFNKSKELQCRHYVLLKSAISDAVQSDRARLMVERYFYKVEVRR